MAKILLQTTIPLAEDDWNVSRFSLLREALVADGHEVIARNEELDTDRNDRVIMQLPDSDFDQLWLMAVDTGEGLTEAESNAIIEFRKRGGGVLNRARSPGPRALPVSSGFARSVQSLSHVQPRARQNRERRPGQSKYLLSQLSLRCEWQLSEDRRRWPRYIRS